MLWKSSLFLVILDSYRWHHLKLKNSFAISMGWSSSWKVVKKSCWRWIWEHETTTKTTPDVLHISIKCRTLKNKSTQHVHILADRKVQLSAGSPLSNGDARMQEDDLMIFVKHLMQWKWINYVDAKVMCPVFLCLFPGLAIAWSRYSVSNDVFCSWIYECQVACSD